MRRVLLIQTINRLRARDTLSAHRYTSVHVADSTGSTAGAAVVYPEKCSKVGYPSPGVYSPVGILPIASGVPGYISSTLYLAT